MRSAGVSFAAGNNRPHLRKANLATQQKFDDYRSPGEQAVLACPEAVRENEEVGPVNVSTWVLPLGAMVGR